MKKKTQKTIFRCKHSWLGGYIYFEDGKKVCETQICSKCGAVRGRKNKREDWKVIPFLVFGSNYDRRLVLDFSCFKEKNG